MRQEEGGPPIYLDGVVYRGRERFMFALDAATGAIKWQRYLAGHPSEVCSKPQVYGTSVIVGTFGDALYSLDIRSGRTNWIGSGSPFTCGTQVAIEDGVVFASSYGYLWAGDARTGAERWRATVNPQGSPVVSSHLVLVAGYSGTRKAGTFVAVDALTGVTRWENSYPGSVDDAAVPTTPVVSNQTVFFPSLDKRLHALDVATGHERWSYQTDAPIRSSPALSSGVLIFGTDNGSMLTALDSTSGELRWKSKLGCPVNYSSPEALDGVVYMPASKPPCEQKYDGGGVRAMLAVDAVSGRLLWEQRIEEFGPVGSKPSVGGGLVFQPFDGRLYAFKR